MAGAIYTDIISRFDGASANSVANQLIGMFRKTGEDASKAMNSGLSQMGSSFSTAGMRAELASAEAEVKHLRDAEAEAARVMVKANNDIEVSTRRAAEVTAKFGETSSQAARAIGAQTDAELRAAIATNKYADSMLATEAAAKKATTAHTEAGTAAGAAASAFNKLGAGALVLAGGTILETGKMAGHLQQQMLKLGSTAGETGDLVGGHFTGNLQTVQKGILDLMGSTGYSSEELARAMYIVESAGYRGNDALKVLTAGAQGASSEGADLTEVVRGLTTSMTDFGVGPEGVMKLMSQMVVATGEAKVTFQEFAGALSSVEPAAAAAGLKVPDIWGTLAQMTQSGMSANQASVDMNQAITSLSRPNDIQAKKMQQLGINPDQIAQNLRERGLAGTMQDLYADIFKHQVPGTDNIDTGELARNAGALADLHGMLNDTSPGALSDDAKQRAQAYLDNSKGNRAFTMDIRGMDADNAKKLQQFKELTDQVNAYSSRFAKGRDVIETANAAMGDITGTVEALRVMLQTTGKQADDTNERIKKIAEADLDPDGKVKGFTKSQEGFDAKMRDVKGGFEALGISLGETFLPALDKAANGLHDIVDFMSSHETVVKDMAIAVAGLGTAWAGWKAIQGIRTVISGAIDGFTNLLGVADRAMGGISQKVINADTEFRVLGTTATTTATQVETAATAEGGAQEGVTTKAAAANTAMGTERSSAAEAGVAGVETSATAEVAAEERVTTAADGANAALNRHGGPTPVPTTGPEPVPEPEPTPRGPSSLPIPAFIPLPPIPSDIQRDLDAGKFPSINGPTPHAAGGLFGPMPSGATIAPPSGRGLVQWAEDSTGGESYIPLNGGQHSIDIWAQTGRLLGVFDQGGFRGDVDMSSDDMLGSYGPDVVAAAQRVGTAYSNALRDDCSGMVGQVVDQALGIAGDQLPTTQNMGQWLAERGFVPGIGGPGDISVGWYNHGSGIQDGHAAMTLSNGMNAESGGSHGNFIVGPGAAGASASEFDQHMHLAMGGGGSYAVDQEKVWRAQEHIQKLEDRISVLQEKISEETGKTKQSEKDRLDKELADAKRELQHAKGELAQAERGTYRAGRSGRSGHGGSGDELGGNLPEAFGLKEGLPGLVKYGITALADLAFAPAIGALQAVSQAAGGKERTGSGLMGFLGQQFGFGLPRPEHHANGGPVGTDTVPAWLTPGEVVVNRDAAQSHMAELMAMNAGHYDKGGLIGDPNLPVITDYFQRNYWDAKNDKGEHWPLSEPPLGDQQVWDSDTGLPTQWGPGKGFSSWGDKGQDRGSIRHGDNSDRYPISGADKNGNGAWNYGMWLGPGTDATWQGYFATGGEVPDEPTQIGGVAPAQGTGSGFGGLGGLPMAGLQTAASGLDMLAPGAGQAAQVGIQELNRAAAFAGQVGGILTGGFMDTLIPHESELAGKSWFTKLAGGLAGAKPELPNVAGDKPPAPKQDNQGGDTHIHGDHVGVKIQGDYNGKEGEDAAGADLARHQAATAASGTPRGGFFTG